MSSFNLVRVIKTSENTTINQVEEAFKRSLEKKVKLKVINHEEGELEISGTEKSSTPIFTFEAKVNTTMKDDKAKITIEGSQRTTKSFMMAGVVCILFIWLLIPFIAFIFGLIRYNQNKDQYEKMFEEVLNNISTELDW